MGILVGHALRGVEQQQHDVGAFDGLQGLDDGELLDRLEHTTLAAQAGGVHQFEALPVAFEGHTDGVARGARHVEGDQAFLAKPGVDQGGLAHVGAAGHREADGVGRCLRFILVRLGQARQALQRGLDHRAHALPVRTGHGQHLAQAELEEFDELRALGHALGLVGHQHAGLAQAAQVGGDVVVLRAQAGARVDNEQHHVALGHGLAGLLGHLAVDAALAGVGLEAAGVDDDVFLLAQAPIAVVAVAREAGQVGHNGVACAREAVEQRGLAHIGTTHEGDNGFHGRSRRLLIRGARRRAHRARS